MHNSFRSFAELLAAQPAAENLPEAPSPTVPERGACSCTHEALAEVRLFKARVCEALDEAVRTIVRDIAEVVLARELELQPAAIARITARAYERFFADAPVRVRVNESDARAVSLDLPVVTDAALRPGDALLEVRTGLVDASLGARFAVLLENAA